MALASPAMIALVTASLRSTGSRVARRPVAHDRIDSANEATDLASHTMRTSCALKHALVVRMCVGPFLCQLVSPTVANPLHSCEATFRYSRGGSMRWDPADGDVVNADVSDALPDRSPHASINEPAATAPLRSGLECLAHEVAVREKDDLDAAMPESKQQCVAFG